MESESHIKRIVLHRMVRCTVCHHEFESDDIRIISRNPDMWTMLVECTDCHARNFVAAVMNDGDPKEAKLALRKLSEQTIRELRDPKPEIESEAPESGETVSASDVLDMHEFLGEFDGDFRKLFASS